MPPGAAAPSLDPTVPIIFHNIPYANLGYGAEPGRFAYPLAPVKEVRRARRGFAGAPAVWLHG
jgi:hypothetical protein